MSRCERIEECPLFDGALANMPILTDALKERYCQSDKESCARFWVGATGKTVPPWLFPDDADAANEIISGIVGD
jgi:hypothetical protein